MNYKHLFPTFRNRYLFIRDNLQRLSRDHTFDQALNLGTGEGDYDRMIARHCRQLTACDINDQDIAYARILNQDVSNLTYQVEDALNLSFADHAFDLIISVEVIEHVGHPDRMIEEIGRVLKPGGLALITFPALDFPVTYDPINWILSFFTNKKVSQGAYAFGHDYLVSIEDVRDWAAKQELEVLEERKLSGYLIGLLEMYWTGIVQRIFKANATNLSGDGDKQVTLRPSGKEPALTVLTDALISLDRWLFTWGRASVGKGVLLRKKENTPASEMTN